MARCRRCPAEIRFIIMQKSGRRNPIDPVPTDDGNIVINEDGKGVVLTGAAREAARDNDIPLYTSHFATCPEAKRFRRKREQKRATTGKDPT